MYEYKQMRVVITYALSSLSRARRKHIAKPADVPDISICELLPCKTAQTSFSQKYNSENMPQMLACQLHHRTCHGSKKLFLNSTEKEAMHKRLRGGHKETNYVHTYSKSRSQVRTKNNKKSKDHNIEPTTSQGHTFQLKKSR